MFDAFEGRILALSKAHSLLGREHWSAVGLRDVLDQILRPFGLNDPGVARFSIVGADVCLQPKAALTLAMVFHELATNATKYGALSNGDAGHVDLGWRIETAQPDDRMYLQWRESGGPPVAAPTRRGFGSRLIADGLAQDVDGEVQFDLDPAGLVCSIVMPLPQGLGPMSLDTVFARRRVLVVEDEVLVAWVLSDMLAGLGCTVIGPAGRVQQALEIIAGQPIDAAVLDVNLNGDFSYPIADALVARGVPFVFSTGYDRGRLREGYRGFPHLQKPFLESDLAGAVAAMLTPTPTAGAPPQPLGHEHRL